VAAHLDISTTALRGLIETKVVDDADPGQMDMDAARVAYIRYLRAQASSRGGDRLGEPFNQSVNTVISLRFARASMAGPPAPSANAASPHPR